MIKFKKILLGCAGCYLCAAFTYGYAQNVPETNIPSQKPHYGQHIQEIYNQLDLTAEQKQQLQANKEQHRSMMAQDRKFMKADREALQAELMKPQLDMQRINDLRNKIKDVMFQMEDNKLNSILAVRSILTPEQFIKFIMLMRSQHKQEHNEQEEHHE